jgi:hypothetical protein
MTDQHEKKMGQASKNDAPWDKTDNSKQACPIFLGVK